MKLRGLRLLSSCVFFAPLRRMRLSLDREAFTFTNYDLDCPRRARPTALGARGKSLCETIRRRRRRSRCCRFRLRSSWRSIKAGGKQLQFVSQPYTSDIDHTGALSEAIVTLPEAVAPKGTVDLEIAYEGVDRARCDAAHPDRHARSRRQQHRLGPDQLRNSRQCAARDIVAWYPIATEAANLSEGNSLFEIVGRWKAREADVDHASRDFRAH